MKQKKDITFPVLNVKLVPTKKVVANDYNPNKVATPEMKLLEQSILADGLTQPVVVFYDAEGDLYIVVDGFHRYSILKKYKCSEIPVVAIEKDIKDRMASTIRHNRARGKHQVDLMSSMVAKLIKLGRSDIEIAEQLGMEAEEVLRLKQQTGMLELFKNSTFSHSWEWDEDENNGS